MMSGILRYIYHKLTHALHIYIYAMLISDRNLGPVLRVCFRISDFCTYQTKYDKQTEIRHLKCISS